MGAKTWMLSISDGEPREILKSKPQLDRSAVYELAKRLFPSEELEPIEDGNLYYTCPPDDELLIGCFPGLSIAAAFEFGIDYPSHLPTSFLQAAPGNTVYLHAMHSVVDWFAYAKWLDGKLVRSLSLSPDSGVLEDIGERPAFEIPYWDGEHSPFDPDDEDGDYPFPFHPLDLGEEALLEIFGFQIEGVIDPDHLDAEEIPLAAFRRVEPAKPWWKFWG